MEQRNLIILTVVLLVVAVGVGAGVYYFFFQVTPVALIIDQGNQENETKAKKPEITPEQEIEQINRDYPETVKGVINFLDKGAVLKSTIKTDDGKEYTLWPAEPKSVYESFGAQNGKRVEVKAKILENNRLEWKLMKPI